MKAATAILLAVAAPAADAAAPLRWTTSWATAQQLVEPGNRLPARYAADVTLRQVVRLSIGGERLRVRLSNAFGTAPLVIDHATIAIATAPAAGSVRTRPVPLRFASTAGVVIPAGADYWSDPVTFPVGPRTDVAISLHLPTIPDRQTGHPGSRTTSRIVTGDVTGVTTLEEATPVEHWYVLAGIDVADGVDAPAIVALGDSITDGHGATTNGNDRWPDVVAARFAVAGRRVGVVNAGIGGNRLLEDGLGPNALARFDRDVLSQGGVCVLVLFEGVNDLGTLTRLKPAPPAAHRALVSSIVAAYRQLIDRAHAHGIAVVGGTITPFGGSDFYHPDRQNEADRQAVNRWIRAPGHFDAVADFDAATRNRADPTRLRADLDSGDHLHPSSAGYRIIGNVAFAQVRAMTAPGAACASSVAARTGRYRPKL